MSATIFYEPLPTSPKSLSTTVSSFFLESLRAAGIECPGEVHHENLDALRGMEKLWNDKEFNPYRELIEAITEHGAVRIWVVY